MARLRLSSGRSAGDRLEVVGMPTPPAAGRDQLIQVRSGPCMRSLALQPSSSRRQTGWPRAGLNSCPRHRLGALRKPGSGAAPRRRAGDAPEPDRPDSGTPGPLGPPPPVREGRQLLASQPRLCPGLCGEVLPNRCVHVTGARKGHAKLRPNGCRKPTVRDRTLPNSGTRGSGPVMVSPGPRAGPGSARATGRHPAGGEHAHLRPDHGGPAESEGSRHRPASPGRGPQRPSRPLAPPDGPADL